MSAALLKKMHEMGLTMEQAIELMEVWETGSGRPVPELSAGALRTRKWREKRDTEYHGDVTVTHHGDVTAETEPLSLPLSPQTPQSPTHTRVSINTREHAREEASAFERFWQAYPRKVSKAEARKAFCKAWPKLPPEDREGHLIGGLERAKAGWVDAQFIPHAATWLNGERWNDEPPPASVPPIRQAHDKHHPDQARAAAREDRLGRMLRGAMAAADRHDDELVRGGSGSGH